MQIPIRLGHDARALQTQKERPQRHDVARLRRRIIRLRYYAWLLVDILEDGPVVLECLLARLLEHFAHVLCVESVTSCLRVRMAKCSPHPYAICAIWLLGTILPFAFLTILGDASADAFGATAIVSMVPGNSRLGTVDVLALYILRRWINLGSAHQQHRRNASVKAALTMRDLGSYFWG